MARQLEMFPRPKTEPNRLGARLAADNQRRRARKEDRRIIEARCPSCGETVVVLP